MGGVSGLEAKEPALEAPGAGKVQVVFAVRTERKCSPGAEVREYGDICPDDGTIRAGQRDRRCSGAGSAWLALTLRGDLYKFLGTV